MLTRRARDRPVVHASAKAAATAPTYLPNPAQRLRLRVCLERSHLLRQRPRPLLIAGQDCIRERCSNDGGCRRRAASTNRREVLGTRLDMLPWRWQTPRDLVERNGLRWDHAGRKHARGLQSGDD